MKKLLDDTQTFYVSSEFSDKFYSSRCLRPWPFSGKRDYEKCYPRLKGIFKIKCTDSLSINFLVHQTQQSSKKFIVKHIFT